MEKTFSNSLLNLLAILSHLLSVGAAGVYLRAYPACHRSPVPLGASSRAQSENSAASSRARQPPDLPRRGPAARRPAGADAVAGTTPLRRASGPSTGRRPARVP